jgi:YVTN family beta-propeller protein
MRPSVPRSLVSLAVVLLATACGGAEAVSPPVVPPGGGGPSGNRIVFTVDTVSVNQGQSIQVSAKVLDAAGQPLVGAPLSFSSASGLLEVSSTGVVKGIKPGEATVRATSGELSAEVTTDVYGHPDGLLVGSTPLGQRPFGAAVSRDGLVYITRLDAGLLSSANAADYAIDERHVQVGSVPTGVAFSPDGATAYVTNQYSWNVGVVDVESGAQIAEIPFDGNPFVVRVSPDGERLYVAGNTTQVNVYSTESRALLKKIPVGYAPNGFAVHPTDPVLYVSSVFGSVTEVDMTTDDVLRTFAAGGTPQEVVVSKNGDELFVANEAGWVDIFDLETGARAAQVPVNGGAFGMALSPDQQHLYVGVINWGASTVDVVNIPSRHIIHSIAVGGVPRRIAFTRHGGIAVVANESGYVSFVR